MSRAFAHRVLPFDGVDDFLAGTAPYLREGVEDGDRVVAVTSVASGFVLREALGPVADGVEFAEAERWYRHPARTFADCLGDAEEAARQGRRLRLLGEPVWTSRPEAEVVEWQRVEALVNVAFRETGAWILCPYAVRALPAGVVAAARRTHPESVRGSRVVANPGYVDPWLYSARCDREPLSDPPADAELLKIDVPDLYWLRAYVSDYARQAALPEEDLQRLLVAVTEVVTNALRHGRPPIAMRLWTGPGPVLVCEVTDEGRWAPGTGYGLIPPRGAGRGRFGLWAVRLLCSAVQIRTGDRTVVRLLLRMPHVPAGRNVTVDRA
ncbi:MULTISPECIES: sensor histidine kinase [Actinomadura]|uniref:Anti-sigma factor RsbA family regulatory protein n=1 Tax=Actinomadura yumaensis TaxID=111807 RepID=A0ABW2CXL5_9ACTN|nr:sensor histidine kinase [Actinomadura sp. J1-007]MWK36424.1 sensor histidine kinase [Actinomadura sp. J1-007]